MPLETKGAFIIMKVLVYILFAGLTVTSALLISTANDYHGPMDFSCKDNSTLRHIFSHHANSREDRVWSLGCYTGIEMVYDCQWTGYVNDYDRPFDFQCPGDDFINGLRSIHDHGPKDRRWAFQCCKMRGRIRRDCEDTGFLNDYDGDLNYTTTKTNQLFHGWISIHNNGHEDRIFDFEVCDYVQDGTTGILVCFLVAVLSVTSAFLVSTVNDYDQPMDFSCEGNSTLRHISSHHNNHHEDRVWSMGCYTGIAPVYDCQWTGYVNDFDDPFDFECPGDEFINGVKSYHDNGHEDRRWAFQCCKMLGRIRQHCEDTGFLNHYDDALTYTSNQDNKNIRGWISIHDNGHEDRIFDFQVCEYVEGESST
ncbi:uncharacterized protein LOC117338556 [Pecten maximus]|uniref:uncharacterized protein LOC117338556 n=1 Tax=Pecten maximus TaxID=6579 RepID=UPI0014583DE0|nr:uncharacterized protein LOC117338556 [Pecten maximus]